MLDFLSENYIWFFVAALVLLFALIGFIVEGKKKKNKEFKGDSVEESKTPVTDIEVNDIPVAEKTNEASSAQTVSLDSVTEPQPISENITPTEPIDKEKEQTPEVETQSATIGSPIEMKNEPVIPTAPESFYDEPLIPDNNQEKPMNFEINPNEGNNNERQ